MRKKSVSFDSVSEIENCKMNEKVTVECLNVIKMYSFINRMYYSSFKRTWIFFQFKILIAKIHNSNMFYALKELIIIFTIFHYIR